MSGDGFMVDVPDDQGATVISIEVLREYRRGRVKRAECDHMKITADRMAAEVVCRDCGVRINPVEWIVQIAKQWDHVRSMTRSAQLEQDRVYLRRRVRCRCGETIFLMGRSEDEKRRKAEREGRYREALERISLLAPEVAASSAGKIAQEALAARETGGQP